jgi:hypothetical protein
MGNIVHLNSSTPGDIKLPASLTLDTQGNPLIYDLDGDGKLDIIIGQMLYRNSSTSGNLIFSSRISAPASVLKIGDLDKDGKPDLFCMENTNNGIMYKIYKNESVPGQISFSSNGYVIPHNAFIVNSNLTDMDGDGKLDILLCYDVRSKLTSIIRNTSVPGSLSFVEKKEFEIIYAYDITTGDINVDGKPDMILTSALDGVKEGLVVINTSTIGSISFGSITSIPLPGSISSTTIEINDLDGDAKPDITAYHDNSFSILSLFRNTSSIGLISFESKIDFLAGGFGSTYSANTQLGDLDGDGKNDIITSYQGNLSVFRNQTSLINSPTITSFTPTSAGTGSSITITGTNFTGATSVSFGGIDATSFTVNSSTNITAVVGAGATGDVSVTTPGGTATLAGFTFTVVTAIDPVPASSLGIRFYPNPTTGSFIIDTLKLSDKWETLEIFDSQGKQMLSNFTIKNKTRVSVNVQFLSNGLYMAILKRKKGQATVIKFVKL